MIKYQYIHTAIAEKKNLNHKLTTKARNSLKHSVHIVHMKSSDELRNGK